MKNMEEAKSDDTLLTVDEAATRLRLSKRKLWDLTAPRGPIPCLKIGKSVRYESCDLSAWIQSSKVHTATNKLSPIDRSPGRGQHLNE